MEDREEKRVEGEGRGEEKRINLFDSDVDVRGIPGSKRAAIFLRAIGEEKASEILKRLPEEYVQKITEHMVSLDFVPKKVIKEVAKAVVENSKQEVLVGSGIEYINKILVNVFGPAKAAAIMERLKIFLRIGGGAEGLGSLRQMDPQVIANFIRKEHPQVMAVILAYLDSAVAVEVLKYLPKELHAEILYRIANLERLAPGVIDDIGLIIDEEYRAVGKSKRVGGINSLTEILLNVPPLMEKEIMDALEKKDPKLAEDVRSRMFTFDDIVNIPDRYIPLIIRNAEREQLVKALKGASPQVKEKVLKALPERARKVLLEDMEAIGPVRRVDAERAQQEILRIIRQMEAQGEITVPKGKEEVV